MCIITIIFIIGIICQVECLLLRSWISEMAEGAATFPLTPSDLTCFRRCLLQTSLYFLLSRCKMRLCLHLWLYFKNTLICFGFSSSPMTIGISLGNLYLMLHWCYLRRKMQVQVKRIFFFPLEVKYAEINRTVNKYFIWIDYSLIRSLWSSRSDLQPLNFHSLGLSRSWVRNATLTSKVSVLS